MIGVQCNYLRTSYFINRHFHLTALNCKQTAAISRQVKVFEKLLGSRVSGSKKRWYPSEQTTQSQITSIRDIGKTQGKQGKNASRRINVLNKLFMKHITDQLATGSLSEQIVGKGLEISRVKITPDFHVVNVYWIVREGCCSDVDMETTLHKCSGVLRHELSQLRLMGEVPRIHFVKDKSYVNFAEIEDIIKQCDFDDDTISDQMREELGLEDDDTDLPAMRHDVFGLNHKEMMTKILSKMKKAKDAWNAYEMGGVSGNPAEERTEPGANSFAKLDIVQKKLEEMRVKEESFQKFINSRNFKKSVPAQDEIIDMMRETQPYDDYEMHNQQDSRDGGDYIEESDHRK